MIGIVSSFLASKFADFDEENIKLLHVNHHLI